MKISEKQILRLITVANHFLYHCIECEKKESITVVAKLIDEINHQQSEEIKEIE